MSAVWMHLKLSEKDAKIITSTEREKLFSAASYAFDERKRWLLLVNMMIEIKQLNKLQHVMFSNTCMDSMLKNVQC